MKGMDLRGSEDQEAWGFTPKVGFFTRRRMLEALKQLLAPSSLPRIPRAVQHAVRSR
jgi:hypothetical protein